MAAASPALGQAGTPAEPDKPAPEKPPRTPRPARRDMDGEERRPAGPRSPWLALPPTPELPGNSKGETRTLNGVPIWFAQFGPADGQPVLLLHGGFGNSDHWGHQVRALAGRYRVIVMDTRGHGRSPVTARMPFGFAHFAADVSALLEALGTGPAAIVGWSDGAITGLQLAITTEKVRRLFAFGANFTPDGLVPGGSRKGMFPTYAARCRAEYEKLSPEPKRWPELSAGMAAVWRREPNFSPDDLSTLRTDATVAIAAHDEIIRRDHAERLAKLAGNRPPVVFETASHFAMLQEPTRFTAALEAFLAAP